MLLVTVQEKVGHYPVESLSFNEQVGHKLQSPDYRFNQAHGKVYRQLTTTANSDKLVDYTVHRSASTFQ